MLSGGALGFTTMKYRATYMVCDVRQDYVCPLPRGPRDGHYTVDPVANW